MNSLDSSEQRSRLAVFFVAILIALALIYTTVSNVRNSGNSENDNTALEKNG